MLRRSLALIALSSLVAPGVVAAQDDGQTDVQDVESETGQPPAIDEEQWRESGADTNRLDDEQVVVQESYGTEAAHDSSSPYEDPHSEYMFLGIGYQHSFLPEFVLSLFTEESVGTNNPRVALEFTYRKDNFDIIGSLYWQRFETYGPFLGPGDEDTEVEMIDSSLGAVMAGVTFLWSTPFNDVFAFQYGLGLGIGMVYGDLRRTEAFPNPGNTEEGAVGGFAPCAAPSDPRNPLFCDATSVRDGERGGHYNIKARRWFDGGSVPNLWFRAALPHLAFRIKPIHQLMFRIEGGFDLLSGFFVGGSMAYGF